MGMASMTLGKKVLTDALFFGMAYVKIDITKYGTVHYGERPDN